MDPSANVNAYTFQTSNSFDRGGQRRQTGITERNRGAAVMVEGSF
jgi:hypothetical protein